MKWLFYLFPLPLYMSFSTFLSNTLLKSNTIFIISRKVCKSSQSGNFIIFLSLKFYVKPILKNLEAVKLQVLTILEL